MKRKLTPQEWMDDILEYERTHEIAFVSSRPLVDHMIAEMDKARRPQRRARRNGTAPRRKTVAA